MWTIGLKIKCASLVVVHLWPDLRTCRRKGGGYSCLIQIVSLVSFILPLLSSYHVEVLSATIFVANNAHTNRIVINTRTLLCEIWFKVSVVTPKYLRISVSIESQP